MESVPRRSENVFDSKLEAEGGMHTRFVGIHINQNRLERDSMGGSWHCGRMIYEWSRLCVTRHTAHGTRHTALSRKRSVSRPFFFSGGWRLGSFQRALETADARWTRWLWYPCVNEWLVVRVCGCKDASGFPWGFETELSLDHGYIHACSVPDWYTQLNAASKRGKCTHFAAFIRWRAQTENSALWSINGSTSLPRDPWNRCRQRRHSLGIWVLFSGGGGTRGVRTSCGRRSGGTMRDFWRDGGTASRGTATGCPRRTCARRRTRFRRGRTRRLRRRRRGGAGCGGAGRERCEVSRGSGAGAGAD